MTGVENALKVPLDHRMDAEQVVVDRGQSAAVFVDPGAKSTHEGKVQAQRAFLSARRNRLGRGVFKDLHAFGHAGNGHLHVFFYWLVCAVVRGEG